jgi:hypothetical protein
VVLLALAILFGLIGFAVHFLWFGSIVLMAVLLGLIVSEMRSRRGKSVISEVVTTVMVEAKSVAEAIASGGDNCPSKQDNPEVANSLSAVALNGSLESSAMVSHTDQIFANNGSHAALRLANQLCRA